MKRTAALLATAAALLALVGLASCGYVEDGTHAVGDAFTSAGNYLSTQTAALNQPEPPKAELVLEVSGAEASGRVVYAMDMSQPWLVQPFMHWVDDGYYDGLYLSRVVPGMFAESDNGFWSNRKVGHPIRVAYDKDGNGPAQAGQGNIGLVTNRDGTVGPRLLMMTGGAVTTFLDRTDVPPSAAIGTLTEGADVLAHLSKGDKITKAYGRNFLAAPEPYY
jgi:cyclophilin family peptidyl-prolyl cis-trans isomerase